MYGFQGDGNVNDTKDKKDTPPSITFDEGQMGEYASVHGDKGQMGEYASVHGDNPL